MGETLPHGEDDPAPQGELTEVETTKANNGGSIVEEDEPVAA